MRLRSMASVGNADAGKEVSKYRHDRMDGDNGDDLCTVKTIDVGCDIGANNDEDSLCT